MSDADIPQTPAEADVPSDWAETGIERRRERLDRKRRRDKQLVVGFMAGVAIVALIGGGAVWALSAFGGAKVTSYLPVRSSKNKAIPVASPSKPVAVPTPYFAQHGSVTLRLPVSVDDLTEVGFHQAAYRYAVKLSTKLPDADSSKAKKNGGTGRNKASQSKTADAWLVGSVLRMWRGRPGKPDTAADVGAKAGSRVIAPVDGRVRLVKHYELYGKYGDYEIHIQPDGAPTLDLVMIHIDEPVVRAGDRVSSGITPIGKVRKLSDRIRHQLGHYSGDPGDHTHLQLNDATDPKYKGLDDAPALPAD
ncbi:MAG TPA: M23 family metallopeptidase [Coriobacteriia bacterium]|nr:M23 family metallopeptidase [Coriobacteriia bacterium]